MQTSLYLDPVAWDLALDASGNIAVASEPYRLAQDAATAIRTFLGECYYDTTQGVAYWTDILGRAAPIQLIKADLVKAALTVPGVVNAQVFLTSIDRALQGQVQVTDTAGVLSVAGF